MTKTENKLNKEKNFFGEITSILNLYVVILAIVGVLITIEVLSYEQVIKKEELPATYFFNKNKLKNIEKIKPLYNELEKISDSSDYFYFEKPILNAPDSLNGKTSFNFRVSKSDYYFSPDRISIEYFMPDYKIIDVRKEAYLYNYGVDDTIVFHNSFNSGRHILKKKSMLNEAIGSFIYKTLLDDSVKLTRINGLKTLELHFCDYNPLDSIKKFDEIDFKELSQGIDIYTPISINNPSNYQITNIKVKVSKSYTDLSKLELLFWTSATPSLKVDTSFSSTLLEIGSLEPNTSIEFVFRGKTILHSEDILVSFEKKIIFDQRSIIIYMISGAIFVLLLYFAPHLIKVIFKKKKKPHVQKIKKV